MLAGCIFLKQKTPVASRVNPLPTAKAVYQVPKKHSMTRIVDRNHNTDCVGQIPKPNLKIQDLLSKLTFLEVASVIHCASEALRHDCGFARCYADLGINIALFHSGEEDCDWMREDIADIRDTRGLVNLITMASFRLQTLSK